MIAPLVGVVAVVVQLSLFWTQASPPMNALVGYL
jgi:hypothetical protein